MKIISYNCRGFKQRNYNYILDLFSACDILLLQETWLYSFQVSSITNLLPDSLCHAVPSMSDDDIGRQSRPYGGVTIIWH